MKVTPGVLRLILAFLVVLDHFSSFDVGACAVDVFFVLSGYWIYAVYEKKYSQTRAPVVTFLVSRLFRLLPVFLLFNTMALGAHALLQDENWMHGCDVHDVVADLGIVSYAGLPWKPMVPAWSLDIELQFYLIVPLILLVTAQDAIRKRWIVAITAGLLVADVALNGLQHRSIGSSIVYYIGFFASGMLAAKSNWRPSDRLFKASGAFAVGIALLLTGLHATRGILLHKVDPGLFGWNAITNNMLALILIPVAIGSVHQLSNRFDRLLGELSYVLYCAHWIGVLVARRYFDDLHGVTKLAALGGDIGLITLVSVATLLWYDRPISAMREHWVDSRRVRSAALPTGNKAYA